MPHPFETFVPTVMLTYKNVDGKLLLHQLYVSELGNTEWRKVKISGDGPLPGQKTYREVQVFEAQPGED